MSRGGTSGGSLVRLVEALRRRGLTVAVAESCTGGLLGAALTELPGSSAYFLGGALTYSNRSKTELLGVEEELIRAHGAVSRECALAMAAGVRKLLHADLGLSVTGIAGPDREGEKPVGLTFVAASLADREEAREHLWSGDRGQNRAASVEAALALGGEVVF